MSSPINTHLPCEDCGSSDALTEYEKSTYCFSCQKYTKLSRRDSFFEPTESQREYGEDIEKYSDEIPSGIYINFIGRFGIDPATCKKYGIKYCEYYSKKGTRFRNRIVFPLFHEGEQVGLQARATMLDDEPKYLTAGTKEHLFWTHPKEKGEIVIVEDILSAIKVGKVKPAVALLGTSISDERLLTLAENYDTIYIWLDGDGPGKRAAQKLHDKLILYTDNLYRIETKEDPKCVFSKDIQSLLNTSSQ